MANKHHLEMVFRGDADWNEWRREHPEIRPDLRNAYLISNEIKGTALSNTHTGAFLPGIDLSHADLMGIRLGNASLEGANFHYADLHEADLSYSHFNYADLRNATFSSALLFYANFTNADLSGANLSEAFLNKADLSGADLSGADLSGADLSGAILNATNLTNVILEKATLGWTLFANVDLSSVQGLETMKHQGPSSVGFDTLLRSRGKIPSSFLFQTGLNHTMIEALQGQLKQFTSLPACSLGYTLGDQAVALHLQASLQATGAPCWLVARDIPPGTPRPTAVAAFIERYNRLILILSKSALESEEIQEEVKTALTMEKERNQQLLFLINIDDSALFSTAKWVLQLRENHPLVDFTGWQEEERYQQVLQQLFQVLRFP